MPSVNNGAEVKGLGIVDGWLELADGRGFTKVVSEGHGKWAQTPSVDEGGKKKAADEPNKKVDTVLVCALPWSHACVEHALYAFVMICD